jgi:CPA2 family monovalent cation:H+ antiporter-2
MHHATPLISTLVAGFGLAFVFGLVAHRLRLPPLVGYIVAGILIGPYTPGYVADADLAQELAEVGVILLMFGVGLHFSVGQLLAVRAIAVPGAVGQIAVATLAGMAGAALFGWGIGAGFVYGLSLSVASTVVMLRALQDRHLVETERGRIAVGWLVVEDLAMVLALVLIPPLAGALDGRAMPVDDAAKAVAAFGMDPVLAAILTTLAKIAAFVAIMLVAGRRVIPWVLHYTAHTGSRELFRLSVLAIALGVAFGATSLFGVSFALGAFFAGMVMSESPLSSQALRETLPLRDAFAVLFFVSVGMLFDPSIVLSRPVALLATVLVVVVVKSVVAFSIVRAFGHDRDTAFTIAASLAQIGEFSFILIVLGRELAIVPAEAVDLVVAGALIAILLNPFLFTALDRRALRRAAASPAEPPTQAAQGQATDSR